MFFPGGFGTMCLSNNNRNNDVSEVPIRPHHGMCLAYFIGKGYSEGFSAHMEHMLHVFQSNIPVRLIVHTDEICSACPNNDNNLCSTSDKVTLYDKEVLEQCGLSEGMKLDFLEFAGIIQKKIIDSGMRKQICGDCQWNEICSEHQSRWKTLEIR